MPKGDLPGFYFDAEKNRYFPIKGPIPGTSSSPSIAAANRTTKKPRLTINACQKRGIKTSKLLLARELCGNAITSVRGKVNFQEEYKKTQASKPLVWKYQGTERAGDRALEQMHVDIEMPDGRIGTEILVTGSLNGSLCLYEVGKVERLFNNGIKCMPDCVWPLNAYNQAGVVKLPGHIWRSSGPSIQMRSSISCIKMARKHASSTLDDVSSMQHILMTTLGSEMSGGSVYLFNLSEPLDYNSSASMMRRRMHEIISFQATVWDADCNSNGTQAVIGTNLGAALVDIERRTSSWICRCKSDVLSLQADHMGRNVLCGLRNGAVVTVDTRQKPEALSNRFIRHRIPHRLRDCNKSMRRVGKDCAKQWFELTGDICTSNTVNMPSSISSLVQLRLYDQYFLASSMDGSIKLYDNRLTQRGPLQSYEGNVNSHTRIQLGVDSSEKMFMSGGEDGCLRIWNIKSGELLFEDKFMESTPSVVCWPGTKELLCAPGLTDECRDYEQHFYSGAWLGSQEGLFYMHWP